VKAHSFFPGLAAPTLFAMGGDDLSLHFDLEKLTPKQQADHRANVVLTGLLQVALLAIGKPGDHVALYAEFGAPKWRSILDRYSDLFQHETADGVSLSGCSFHPSSDFYGSIVRGAPQTPTATLYMVSGSNAPLHGNEAALAVSRNANSKFHFADHAPAAGVPTPQTLAVTKGALGTEEVAAFFRRFGGEVIVKTLGLAGARNVFPARTVEEAAAHVAEYGADMPVLLQEKLNLTRYTEMTADLIVADDDVRIANVRRILFSDGVWVGNQLGSQVSLRPEDEAALLNVGAYARAQGYSAPEGLNCGVDFFVSADDIVVTEINARWTGGLFPAQIIAKAGLESHDCVAFIDQAPADRVMRYLDFCERHAPRAGGGDFVAVPFGFAPFPTGEAEDSLIFVWQLVAGDFEAFKAAKRDALGAEVLPTADRVSLEL